MSDQHEQQGSKRGPDGRFAKGNKSGKPFQPGHSGNPNGRPKGPSFTSILNDILDGIPAEEGTKLSRREKKLVAREFVMRAIEHAMDGRSAQFQEIWNRRDGILTPDSDADAGPIFVEFEDDWW